jgi:hypothetical protein
VYLLQLDHLLGSVVYPGKEIIALAAQLHARNALTDCHLIQHV